MRTTAYLSLTLTLVTIVSGCGGAAPSQAPQFEVRDFVVTEKKEEATSYSKEWNSFLGKGTVVARNVDKDRNLMVVIEMRDETLGQSSEPSKAYILVRGGIGQVEVSKSEYQTVSVPPKYSWNVIGWWELHKATIETPGQSAK